MRTGLTVWMVQRGEDHQSLRPFVELPAETQDKDRSFVAAIHAACREGLPGAGCRDPRRKS